MKRLSQKEEQYFMWVVRQVAGQSRLGQSKAFCQHGSTSVYAHSLKVAYASYRAAACWRLPIHRRELIRGALLHDYFLYDWHDREHEHRRPHGFFHADAAWRNARKDFSLTRREENIIRRHMFPLTPIPPRYLEAWLVCGVDKIISLAETFQGRD
ncbi:MAG: HD domain-containing protein [Lachnospiraceae bacterium]|nr:HD domain-containing protein [Lachnospiraceae bacterium]